MSEVARNARQASRFLDEIVSSAIADIDEGHRACSHNGTKNATGTPVPADAGDQQRPADATRQRQGRQPDPRRRAISAGNATPSARSCWCRKDINMRIKARALGLAAEDYFNDKVLEDTDLLLPAVQQLPADFWDKHGKDMESWQQAGHTYYRLHGPLCASLHVNEFVYHEARQTALRAGQGSAAGKTAVLQTLKDYTHQQEQRLGHHRAQPRAELRAQPADEPGDRLRHAARPGRHRQDAADARRRPDADARAQALHRDHHDARHGAGRRGHRLPARHRGRKDEAVDGRARGQPRRAQQDRRRRRANGAAPRRAT